MTFCSFGMCLQKHTSLRKMMSFEVVFSSSSFLPYTCSSCFASATGTDHHVRRKCIPCRPLPRGQATTWGHIVTCMHDLLCY